ncbi:isochorismatase family protein [Kineococcus rubinsiae]|uniref:isochorismatase family protein n=1 Tax=Kineococcus rubinsiae TaxID=2609562 RepID=UPI00142FA4CE|nr:isochorismatase family protein [Kineococcus rubinsiae]NIZ90869.1 isochorismatase family protein [Kineococcus rubinsiae]
MPAPRRALVVVDVQQEYFDGPLEIQHPPRAESLANVVSAVRAADAAGLPVVVVRHHLPAGAPIFAEGSPGHALHPDVEAVVDPSWKQVLKQNGSVFAGTDLAEWLRGMDVDTVTLVGYMTNNCDLASAVEAEGLGFAAEVLSDATGAIELSNAAGTVSAEQLHTTLMVLLHSNFAAVATTAQWLTAVADGAALPTSDLVTSALAGRSVAS